MQLLIRVRSLETPHLLSFLGFGGLLLVKVSHYWTDTYLGHFDCTDDQIHDPLIDSTVCKVIHDKHC